MEQYIATHWKGNFPLWKSYWINSVVLSMLAAVTFGFVVGIFLGIMSQSSGTHIAQTSYDAIGTIISLPILVWSIVGTWRSATEYSQQRQWQTFTWGTAAKIALTLGVCQVAARIAMIFVG